MNRYFFAFLRRIRSVALSFSGLLAAAAFLSALFWLEVVKLHHSIGENSIIEISQLVMLFLSGGLVLHRASQYPEIRGGLILVGGFCLCAGIREMDAFFDVLLWHGAWAPIAIAVALLSCIFAKRAGKTVLSGLLAVARDQNVLLLCSGLVILLVFSRVFGNKQIWISLGALNNIEPSLTRVFKNFGEETTEALGDLLIFVWALFFKGKPTSRNSDTIGDK